ncbi:MAG: hypothetical protein CVT92_07805 [Bacteroidetes bacterium HGW-Bacteroidetes-1]|jgi:PAS domain S-box-containing protein|nr:MAG: hypothetical protein CVT92_07805 [Bacteroidetes bacterium HGW-Bacteroidetes-1]
MNLKAKIRILHIDDNTHDRQLVKDVLRKEKDLFELTEADSREKFEKLLSEHDFDVILSDFNILGFDGLQVLEVVKKMKPDLPVIIVTGTGSEEIAIQAMKMGAADYVIKTVNHILGLAHTITIVLDHKRLLEDKKKTQEELIRTNASLDSIIENIPNMLFIKEAAELRYVRFNRAGEELLGYSNTELVGKNDYDFFPKEQADFFIKKDREVLKNKVLLNIPEETIQTKHKGIRVLHTRKVPVLNAKGEPEFLLGISEDITERKRTEEALITKMRELEKFNALMVGRENKMISLKHEINALCAQLNLPSRYDPPQELE